MARVIQKKAYTQYFDKILNGEKTFDLRVADFDVEEGDIIELVEIDENRQPTGRIERRKVGTVARTRNIQDWYPPEDVEKYGYVIMSLGDKENV